MEASFAEIFAVWLSEARKVRGLGQKQLGKEAKISQSIISALERADEKRPVSSRHIVQLLRALDMSASTMCEALASISKRPHESLRATIAKEEAEKGRVRITHGRGQLLVAKEHEHGLSRRLSEASAVERRSSQHSESQSAEVKDRSSRRKG